MLYARFRAKGLQGEIGAIASSPTEQLQSLGVYLSVVSYRNGTSGSWMFRERFPKIEAVSARNLRGAARICEKEARREVRTIKTSLWFRDTLLTVHTIDQLVRVMTHPLM